MSSKHTTAPQVEQAAQAAPPALPTTAPQVEQAAQAAPPALPTTAIADATRAADGSYRHVEAGGNVWRERRCHATGTQVVSVQPTPGSSTGWLNFCATHYNVRHPAGHPAAGERVYAPEQVSRVYPSRKAAKGLQATHPQAQGVYAPQAWCAGCAAKLAAQQAAVAAARGQVK